MGSARTTLPHISSVRTEDQDEVRDTRNTLPHISNARTEEQRVSRDTRTRTKTTLFGTRATRCRTSVVSALRNNSYPVTRIPGTNTTLSGTRAAGRETPLGTRAPGNTATTDTRASGISNFTAQFRPWIIQFEAIARHQGWTAGERVVQLVSSLTGPAANLLIGMTMGQLDNYNFLRTCLSHRYDPPEREDAHRAELRVRTRRRNESADEFAENIKDLAQRAYPLADQNMLDNLVVKRFREGHGNEELKKHLCLYLSTGLQDLIGACMRFRDACRTLIAWAQVTRGTIYRTKWE